MISTLKEQGWSLGEIFWLPTQMRNYQCELIKERMEAKLKKIKNTRK